MKTRRNKASGSPGILGVSTLTPNPATKVNKQIKGTRLQSDNTTSKDERRVEKKNISKNTSYVCHPSTGTGKHREGISQAEMDTESCPDSESAETPVLSKCESKKRRRENVQDEESVNKSRKVKGQNPIKGDDGRQQPSKFGNEKLGDTLRGAEKMTLIQDDLVDNLHRTENEIHGKIGSIPSEGRPKTASGEKYEHEKPGVGQNFTPGANPLAISKSEILGDDANHSHIGEESHIEPSPDSKYDQTVENIMHNHAHDNSNEITELIKNDLGEPSKAGDNCINQSSATTTCYVKHDGSRGCKAEDNPEVTSQDSSVASGASQGQDNWENGNSAVLNDILNKVVNQSNHNSRECRKEEASRGDVNEDDSNSQGLSITASDKVISGSGGELLEDSLNSDSTCVTSFCETAGENLAEDKKSGSKKTDEYKCPSLGCDGTGHVTGHYSHHRSLSGCPRKNLKGSLGETVQKSTEQAVKCPTLGCDGRGHVNSSRISHRSLSGCPIAAMGKLMTIPCKGARENDLHLFLVPKHDNPDEAVLVACSDRELLQYTVQKCDSDRVLRPMIQTKQLDMERRLKYGISLHTPRSDLAKELDKYSHLEKPNNSGIKSFSSKSQTSPNPKPVLNTPMPELRPNILRRRPHIPYRPHYKSSPQTHAINLSTKAYPSNESEENLDLSMKSEAEPSGEEMCEDEPVDLSKTSPCGEDEKRIDEACINGEENGSENESSNGGSPKMKFTSGKSRDSFMFCPTPDCDGSGHISGNYSSHRSLSGCPMADKATIQANHVELKCPTTGCDGSGHVTGNYSSHRSLSGCPRITKKVMRLPGIKVEQETLRCPVPGCDGLGHVTGKYTSHRSASGCPVSSKNKVVRISIGVDGEGEAVEKPKVQDSFNCPTPGCDGAGHVSGTFSSHRSLSGCPMKKSATKQNGFKTLNKHDYGFSPEENKVLQNLTNENDELCQANFATENQVTKLRSEVVTLEKKVSLNEKENRLLLDKCSQLTQTLDYIRINLMQCLKDVSLPDDTGVVSEENFEDYIKKLKDYCLENRISGERKTLFGNVKKALKGFQFH